MKKENLKNAEEKARKCAVKYNKDVLIPFPFEKIVEEEKDLKEIVTIDLEEIGKKFGESFSGLISFSEQETPGKDEFTIYVNSKQPNKRQYFTTAHELGHYFLHKDKIKQQKIVTDSDIIWYRTDRGLPKDEETEANYFAAALLMPEDKVKEVWEEVNDVKICAEIFNVSLAAMGIRLDYLKLSP